MDPLSSRRLPIIGGALILLLLSGCARERVGAPGLSGGRTSEAHIAEVRTADEQVAAGTISEASVKLKSREESAFARTGELDRNLNAAESRQVKYHFAKYVYNRRSTMEKYLRNSIPYLNHSKMVFRKNGLPEELAYLAFLESGYNPLAISSSKAVGMWQFMAPTGREYGLRQDWWIDERMDPVKSTESAAKYLSKLYSIFHDWHLAIASYNGGEGKIGRAKNATGAGSLHEIIQKNGTLSYDMQLREETRLYVPRFLALAKIMRDPEKLGIRPAAPDPSHPVIVPFVGLKAKPATDLVELARRLGMTWKEFLAYNPQFLRSVSPAGRESTVYVPRTREQQARSLLTSSFSGAGWTWYTVRRKDTIARVSTATGVPAAVIAELNPGALKEGRRLRLPARAGSAAPARSTAAYSPSSSSPYDHASAALAELEQISETMPASSATVKQVSSGRGGQGVSTPGQQKNAYSSAHVVKAGETASGIARAYGVSLKDLAAANGGMEKMNLIAVGSTLRIPGRGMPVAEPVKAAAPENTETGRNAAKSIAPVGANASIAGAKSVDGNTGQAEAVMKAQKPMRGQESSAAPRQESSSVKSNANPALVTPVPATHTVKAGETVSSIARMYGISFASLCAANGGMEKLNVLSVGRVLKLPSGGASVSSADSSPMGSEKASAPAQPMKAAPVPMQAAKSAPAVRVEAPAGTAKAVRPPSAVPAASPAVITGKPAAPSSPARNAGTLEAGKSNAEGKAQSNSQTAAMPETWTVQPGDTVWKIARRFNISPNQILTANGMDESVRLKTGDTIRLKK